MSKNINISFDQVLLRWQTSVQRLLMIVVVVSLLTAVFRYQKTIVPMGKMGTPIVGTTKDIPASAVSLKQPLSFYTDLVSQRDIFRFDRQASVITELASSPVNQNFSTRFILQGIVLDKNPQVIVKDNQSGKVYFVHHMQTLDGATLKEIQSNKAVFTFAGETLELIKK